MRNRDIEIGGHDPLERSIQTDVHEGACHTIAGEWEGQEMWYDVPGVTAEIAQVDNDSVDYEEREAGEETETEEDNVGSGRRAEEEREGVHPGSEGHAVGDEEEDDRRESDWVREKLIL